TIHVRMAPEHRRLYEKAEKAAVLELENGENIPITSAVALITRLRQIATYPAALEMTDYQPKTQVLLELLPDILAEDRQVVIFGWFRAYLYRLQEILKSKNIECEVITGDTRSEKRHEIQVRFRKKEFPILIGNMAAAGEGLNFDNADTAIFVENDWVPARNEQAEDRLHRMTTKKSPTIIRLVCKDTIDEDILAVSEDKSEFISETLNVRKVIESLMKRYGKHLGGRIDDSGGIVQPEP